MTCGYCGHQMPVPDIKKRRAAMEREAAHRRKLEQRQQQERLRREREAATEQKQTEREKRRRRYQRFASARGCLFSIPIFLVCLIGPGIGLYQSGVYEGLVGDPGGEAHARVAASAAAGGYRAAAEPQVARLFSSSGEQVLELRDDLCYAFTAASGGLISSFALMDPAGATVTSSDDTAFSHILTWCPSRSGVYKLRVTLDELAGRYTWGWYWAESAGVSTTPQTSTTAPLNSAPSTARGAGRSGGSRSGGSSRGGGASKGSGRGSRSQKKRH